MKMKEVTVAVPTKLSEVKEALDKGFLGKWLRSVDSVLDEAAEIIAQKVEQEANKRKGGK